jgi:hypothetical protein
MLFERYGEFLQRVISVVCAIDFGVMLIGDKAPLSSGEPPHRPLLFMNLQVLFARNSSFSNNSPIVTSCLTSRFYLISKRGTN